MDCFYILFLSLVLFAIVENDFQLCVSFACSYSQFTSSFTLNLGKGDPLGRITFASLFCLVGTYFIFTGILKQDSDSTKPLDLRCLPAKNTHQYF